MTNLIQWAKEQLYRPRCENCDSYEMIWWGGIKHKEEWWCCLECNDLLFREFDCGVEQSGSSSVS